MEKTALPKAVILDGYSVNPGDMSFDALSKLCDLTVYDRTAPDEIVSRASNAEIVITNKVPLSEKTLEALPRLAYITVLATGYNIIDTKAASRLGIKVSNVPEYSTEDVMQTVFALLLEICRHVGAHSDAVSAGRWASCPDFCFWDSPLLSLTGKTMGIIGAGRIGTRVAEAAKAFGMKTLCCGVQDKPGRVSLDTVLRESDVISLHCPLTPETKGLICRDTIEKMKDGAILINTARGPVLVEEDVRDALLSGKLYAAGMDVLSSEPPAPDHPLVGLKNCIITPHFAWASETARIRLINETALNIQSFLDGHPRNVVNP